MAVPLSLYLFCVVTVVMGQPICMVVSFVDGCLQRSGTWRMPPSQHVLCVSVGGAPHLLGCLICRWLPAASGTWRMPPSQYILLVSVGGAARLVILFVDGCLQ